MAAGLRVYKENGSLLLDTEKITYGLLKSGYLSQLTTWPRLFYRSDNLDPNDPSSYQEGNPRDPVFGFSVNGAVAPIVFITGPGSTSGASKSGDVTSFYYLGADASTKFYYFDTMRNTETGAGLKCFSQGGELTFNSLQYPLNIIASVQAPLPGPTIPNTSGQRFSPYAGGSVSVSSSNGPLAEVLVPISGGEFAASITFTRSCGFSGDRPYPYLCGLQEGAYGVSGGVRFMFRLGGRTTEYLRVGANTFLDLPTDRYPTALVIRTETLPFPFN